MKIWYANRVFIEFYQDVVTCLFDISSFKDQMRWRKDPESVLIMYWKFLACCLIIYILIEDAKKSEKMNFSQNKMPISSIEITY